MKNIKPPVINGIQEISLVSWQDFYLYINQTLPNPQDYIFRGQRMASWRLESSLDRAIRKLGPRISSARVMARHLEQFQLAARARRGTNPQHLDELGCWALGQHYGLWTPLLDWTESPFVALYFAFEKENERQRGIRAVFALSRSLIQSRCEKIVKEQPSYSPARPDIVEFVAPEMDENARLVSQGGLFTKGTIGVGIEEWVSVYFEGNSRDIALVKILVPEKKGDRVEILRMLNRMNINHRSLFPDIEGSAKFCNMRLSVPNY